jgi:hypothetical protein
MRVFRQVFFLGLIFFLSVPLWAAQEKMNETSVAKPRPPTPMVSVLYIPGPKVVSPVSETVDISSENSLRFTWEAAKVPFEVYCFLFRIYRGTDINPKNVVFAEQVSGLSSDIDVPVDYFKEGEVYTWYVKQVNNGPQLLFSDPAYGSFKIINKKETQ